MLPKAKNDWTLFEAAHLLNRAGFGGNPSEIKTFHALGRQQAVESLIQPTESLGAFPLPAWCAEEQIRQDVEKNIQQRREMQRARRNQTPEEAEKAKREARRADQQESRQRAFEAQAWWFRRMLKTEAPLREKMTLFWHDHFATSYQKVKLPTLLVKQNELFRQHAFGSSRDLTHAILMDPAMMLYLDTQSSKKGMPNENFAREVMELFTLGEGNYTEQDIREAARAFTGYNINRVSGKVTHLKTQWDSTDKTVFGTTGPLTGKEVIDLIFKKRRPPGSWRTKSGSSSSTRNHPDPPSTPSQPPSRNPNSKLPPCFEKFFYQKNSTRKLPSAHRSSHPSHTSSDFSNNWKYLILRLAFRSARSSS